MRSVSRRYWWTNAIAMLPSPTAAATRLTGLEAHVAAGEHAGNARFEQIGIAIERPGPGRGDVGSGEDKAAAVERDLRGPVVASELGQREHRQPTVVLAPRVRENRRNDVKTPATTSNRKGMIASTSRRCHSAAISATVLLSGSCSASSRILSSPRRPPSQRRSGAHGAVTLPRRGALRHSVKAA